MLAQMDSIRSPKSGFYHDWQNSRGKKSVYTILPDNAYGMLSELIGYQTGERTKEDTIGRLSLTLSALENSDKSCVAGFFPTLFNTDTAEPDKSDLKVAAVDNVHLFLANIAIGEMLPELHEVTQRINSKMDFSFFFDPDMGLMHGVYLPDTKQFLKYHHGALNSETRLADYVFMVQTENFDHYDRLYRNIPRQYTDKLSDDYSFYTLKHKPLFESNGGNLFEDAMPLLFFSEELVAPSSWGVQHREMIEAEKEYGNQYLSGLWGHIPTDDPVQDNGYVVAGIRELAANSAHVEPNVISPFASLLVTRLYPEEVASNLQHFKISYPDIYNPGKGFYDSVDVKTGKISTRYLALNVGMALVGVSDYLNNGFIRNLTSGFFGPILPTIASEKLIL